MDWLLVLIAAIIFLMVLVMNLYVLYYYMDPQDKNVAWLPKIVVVRPVLACTAAPGRSPHTPRALAARVPSEKPRAALQIVGLSLACYGVLMLPLDVANRNFALGKGLVGASLPVSEMWQVVLLVRDRPSPFAPMRPSRIARARRIPLQLRLRGMPLRHRPHSAETASPTRSQLWV